MAKAKVALPPALIDTQRANRGIDPGIDVGIEKLVLDAVNTKAPDFDITKAITAADLERTIDGASTISLTCFDPDRVLLRSGVFDGAVDIELDGLHFRLAAVSKSDDELQMTFEERAIALLRNKDKPLKVSRDQVTRAQFIQRLVREVKTYPIDFYSPDLKPEKPEPKKKSTRQRAKTRSKGVASKANITVKGQKANAEQLRNINAVMDAAAKEGARGKALQALVAACIQEREFYNRQGAGADRISFGVLQAIPGRSSGTRGTITKAQAEDIDFIVRSALKHSFTSFENNKGGGLIGVARRHPDWTIGRIAAVVINGAVNGGQGAPAYVNGVNSHRREADKIIAAYGGGAVDSAPAGKYEFSRGDGKTREDSWTAIKRLAEEVNYRAFVSANTLYYISDEELISAQPQLILQEFDEGVQSLDFDIDAGKRAQECTLQVRTPRWRLAPGQAIELQQTGPADGRWLIQSFRRSLFDTQAEVTLKRATKKLPEPKGESDTGRGGVRGATGDAGALSGVKLGRAWGGTQSIFDQFVTPFLRGKGLSAGSAKRTPSQNAGVGGAPGSDHLTTNTNAYAVDYPTTNGAAAATALARAMGQRSWGPGTYNRFTIRVGGKSFSVQILWAVQGHFDHIHVGIRAN